MGHEKKNMLIAVHEQLKIPVFLYQSQVLIFYV